LKVESSRILFIYPKFEYISQRGEKKKATRMTETEKGRKKEKRQQDKKKSDACVRAKYGKSKKRRKNSRIQKSRKEKE